MIDGLAAADALEDARLFALALRRDQNRDGLPDDLLRSVTIKPFRRPVPARDLSVEVFADDCVFRGFNDGDECPARLLTLFARRDVAQIGREHRLLLDAKGVDRQLDENF